MWTYGVLGLWDVPAGLSAAHVVAGVAGVSFLLFILTRSREALLIAVTAALYAGPLLLG